MTAPASVYCCLRSGRTSRSRIRLSLLSLSHTQLALNDLGLCKAHCMYAETGYGEAVCEKVAVNGSLCPPAHSLTDHLDSWTAPLSGTLVAGTAQRCATRQHQEYVTASGDRFSRGTRRAELVALRSAGFPAFHTVASSSQACGALSVPSCQRETKLSLTVTVVRDTTEPSACTLDVRWIVERNTERTVTRRRSESDADVRRL